MLLKYCWRNQLQRKVHPPPHLQFEHLHLVAQFGLHLVAHFGLHLVAHFGFYK